MDNFDFISKLLDGRIVLGKKEEITQDLFIIPVYKVKISFLNLKTDIKKNNGDGESGSINVSPICLLKIYNNNVEIINLDGNHKDSYTDVIPNIMSNIDINSLLKNIKLA